MMGDLTSLLDTTWILNTSEMERLVYFSDSREEGREVDQVSW